MPADSQPPLRLGDEVQAASQMLEIAKDVPLGLSLLQLAAVSFRNEGLEAQANREFRELQEHVGKALYHPKVGFLLEVSVYTNELGNVYIPGGQLLYPIGVGTEPLDALAEHLRVPQLRPDRHAPAGLVNGTYHVWVTRAGEELQAQTIPSQFRAYFFRHASAEATRRTELARWTRALPGSPYKSIVRAEYWIDVERTRAKLISDQDRRQEVAALTSRMRALEARANELYRRHQEALRSMARAQEFRNVLDKISVVASLLRGAIELNELGSGSSDAPVGGKDVPPEASVPRTIEVSEQRMLTDSRIHAEVQRTLRIEVEQLKKLDDTLEQRYRDTGVPLPERGEFEVPDPW